MTGRDGTGGEGKGEGDWQAVRDIARDVARSRDLVRLIPPKASNKR